MKKDMEFILGLAADSGAIIHDDKLAKMILEEDGDEMSEAELDELYAAAKPDVDKFNRFLKERSERSGKL